jgi:hypothetical protein
VATVEPVSLILSHVLLSLVSLGFYMPCANTERRKYPWQNIEIGGRNVKLVDWFSRILAANQRSTWVRDQGAA